MFKHGKRALVSLGGLDLSAGMAGFKNNNIVTTGQKIFNVTMSFLGVVFLLLMIAGGFLWMTAAGNDAKIKTARSLLVAGVIGFIIIASAFVITAFIGDSFLVK